MDPEFLNRSFKSENEINDAIKDADIDVKILIKQRASKRQSATKTLQSVESFDYNSPNAVSFFIVKLTNILNSLNDLDKEIETQLLKDNLTSTTQYDDMLGVSEGYNDRLNMAICRLKNINVVHQPSNQTAGQSSITSKVKLPQVELPQFSGRPEEYNKFINCFESIIGKFGLSQFEKYSYLVQQVNGAAKDIVLSVPHNDIGYDTAKKLLSDAFSSEIVQKFSVINKLVNLKSISDYNQYQWIAEVRTIVDQMNNLNIDVKTITQFFVWNTIPDNYKQCFINLTNSSKPSIDELLTHSFTVVNRINDSKKYSSRKLDSQHSAETTAMATSTFKARSVPICALCEASEKDCEHKIVNCQNYPTPQSKLNQIRHLNGCVKCGLLNHTIAKCRYRFSGKCGNCNKYHAFFLCTGDEKTELVNENKSKFTKKTSKNKNSGGNNIKSDINTINYSVMSADVNENILIPTFTMNLDSNSRKYNCKVRAMYDPASQVSFVAQNYARKIKHAIVRKDVTVRISGFNETKTLKTDIIKFGLKLNGEFRMCEAVVVPEIKTKINQKGLHSICQKFKQNTLPLADTQLLNNNDIGVLLGVDHAHILPVQSCSFGNERKSILYHTCLGFMLAGHVDDLDSNLGNLKFLSDFMQKIRNK